MKKNKIMALLLVSAMTAALAAGCGASEEEPQGEAASQEETDEGNQGEPDEITVALMCFEPMDESETEHVEEALNEQLLEKVNVQADFMWFDPGTYASQIPMMIQANEDLDLLMFTPIPAAGYQSYMSQNQLMDITEYIDEYGTNIKNVMGDYLDATSKDGKVYGVGCMLTLYGEEVIQMNKDVLDENGLTEQAEKMTTWDDYKELLKAVTEKTELNGVINGDSEGSVMSPQPFFNGGEKFSDAQVVDTLGDSYQYVYADEATDEVKCYFEAEGWYENIKRVKEFYEEGLIYKDAATSQETGNVLIKNGVGFSVFGVVEDGGLANFEGQTGHKGLFASIVPTKVGTGVFRKFGFGVPVTAKDPEAAIKVLDLMYGDTEFQDTLAWGVEGVDYVKKEDGTLTYPEGVTAESVQYHTGDFLYGNKLTVTPWEGDGADIREHQKESNKLAERSKYFGFSVDPSEVINEVTACKNVVDQYKPQLSSGSVEDLDATYEEFIAALKAAGMDKIIENYQEQLDAWLEQQ